jgi:uncharacterized damage-inducible protein DinB
MYSTISEFLVDWENEKEYTLKIFRSLTDDKLDQKVCNEGRTLGRVAWHITASVSEMGKSAGLEVTEVDDKAHYPSVEEIAALYNKLSEELSDAVTAWSDEMLKEEIELYGEKWTRAFTLQVLIRHQIHHRAQMTVLMRQAGLKVPGIYGPSREEWKLYNMQPMD